MFCKALLFCGILALSKAFPEPSNEVIDPPEVEESETDRTYDGDDSLDLLHNWFRSDIPSKINLILYTHGRKPYTFHVNDANAANMMGLHGFKSTQQTKIVAHGFTSDGPSFCPPFADAYTKNADSPNVICVDWGRYSKPTRFGVIPQYLPGTRSYTGPARYAIAVGKTLGRELVQKILVKHFGQNPDAIHAVGHSLGAHLVGNLARTFTEENGAQIARVTGLDPAMPFFRNYTEGIANKLRRTDAKFVDIIHTNSEDFHHGGLSFPNPMGDMDFYPNGGKHQPLCTEAWPLKVGIIDLVKMGCSHNMANKFFVDSIENRMNGYNLQYFTSQACDSYEHWNKGACSRNFQVPMGEILADFMKARRWGVNKKTEYKFYLKTRDTKEPPFSLS